MSDEALLQAAREILKRLAGKPIRNYFTTEFGRDRNASGISVIAEESRASSLVRKLRGELPSGLLTFVGTSHWYGDEEHDGVEVVIAPGKDQFDIVRLAESNAVNYNMVTDDLIKKLESYHQRWGIDIFRAETDLIELDFLTFSEDPGALAGDLYDFCPDIIDQGYGSVDALAEYLDEFTTILLWWD